MMTLPIELFSRKQDTFQQLLTRLVEIESPTHEKQAVDRVGELISEELEKSKAQVDRITQVESGNHIVGRWNPNPRSKGILLLCHMDTVHPIGTLAVNPCLKRDGKLYGPGTQDMKGGIAVFLMTMEILIEQDMLPKRPITALFTSDEEVGSGTSRRWIEDLARESELVLCLEPSLPDGSLKTWRKGVGGYEVVVKGKPSHAGAAHADGISAIEELAQQVIKIQGWTDYEQGTTLNVGLIQGGSATNVVPAEARAMVDFRVKTPEEADRILMKFQDLTPVLQGASVEVYGGVNRPPMPRDATMVNSFRRAQKLALVLGLQLGEGGTGGGSDANFVAPLGVPVLDGLGPVGDGQHTEHEYVVLDSLPERAALLAAILTSW